MTNAKKGAFTAYDMEDVCDFIGVERFFAEKNLSGNDSFSGFRLADFMKPDGYMPYFGPLYILYMLLIFFNKDVEVIKYLYRKAKSYNPSNYYSTPNLSDHYLKSLEKAKMYVQAKIHLEVYYPRLSSSYWLDYDTFHSGLLGMFQLWRDPKDKEIAHSLTTEIIKNYLENLHHIAARCKLQYFYVHTPSTTENVFVLRSLAFYKNDLNMMKKIIELNNQYPYSWQYINPSKYYI